jgi:serine/threonine protein kinase
MSETNSKKRQKFLIKKMFGMKSIKDIKFINEGTYSRVFSIDLKDVKDVKDIKEYDKKDEKKVIRVCCSNLVFNRKKIDQSEFFDSGVFRETFFSGILNHPTIFSYETTNYDDELGLYKIGSMMDGDLNDPEFLKHFNEGIFFKLLEDMTNALKHIHSYSLIHSDIKPANILFKNRGSKSNFSPCTSNPCIFDSCIFKLCDFNLIQFCGQNDAKKYKIFATENYSEKNATKSIMVDIYMLGATLTYISSKEIQKEKMGIIDLKKLISKKDDIINNVGFLCYNIIYLMMTNKNDRIYLDHLTKIICAYKIHKRREERKIELLIGDIFSESICEMEVTKTGQYYGQYYLVTSISSKSIYKKNLITMMNFGHTRIKKFINSADNKNMIEYKEINMINDVSTEDKKNDKNKLGEEPKSTDVLSEKLEMILKKNYKLKRCIAKFLAYSIAYYPQDESVETWTKKYTNTQPVRVTSGRLKVTSGRNEISTKIESEEHIECDDENSCTVKEINTATIPLLSENIKIDYHLLVCDKCTKYVITRQTLDQNIQYIQTSSDDSYASGNDLSNDDLSNDDLSNDDLSSNDLSSNDLSSNNLSSNDFVQ